MNTTAFTLIAPKLTPVLDPFFRPAVLANRHYQSLAQAAPNSVPVTLALEQADGSVFHFQTRILPSDHPGAGANLVYIQRLVKFLLW